ncbi:hypothetical protein ACFXAW_34870 [Streptomyces sp. NPDC059445]|uniref:hypothetical protein n=1 Tax=Streptomyces sp. NPDC059445 TaxID=3346832 RepID=UPI003684FFC5
MRTVNRVGPVGRARTGTVSRARTGTRAGRHPGRGSAGARPRGSVAILRVELPPDSPVPGACQASKKKTARAHPALEKTARTDRASTTPEAHQASTTTAADAAAEETS